MPRTALAVSLSAVALAAAGCGGSGTPAASGPTGAPAPAAGVRGKPVTDAQALVLARLLQRNFDDGGAHVTGDFPFSRTARVLVEGQMDWRRLRGTMRVREPARSAAAGRTFFWTRDLVLAQSSPGSRDFVGAKPDPENDPAHFLISALALLSSENIDNVALIRDQGSRFLRRDAIGSTPVDVYQYGSSGRNEYWVGVEDGRLRRVTLDVPNIGGTGTLDFDRRGPQDIELPAKDRRT